MAADISPVTVSIANRVATVEFKRPPHNFVDIALLKELADVLHALDTDPGCRAVVLASEGKNFCAGADFGGVNDGTGFVDPVQLYGQAMRLFETRKPIVAAIQGAAVGAGAGLALVADFRIVSESSRFQFNFNRLGFHPGFGLSYTLPRLVGHQRASRLFFSGERVDGTQAMAIGLADELVEAHDLKSRAEAWAGQFAESAPEAVMSTRATLRGALPQEVKAFNERELALQRVQFQSHDFREGVAAAAARRLPVFTGT